MAKPTQRIVFLGVKINSVTRKLSLPTKKLSEFKILLESWRKKSLTTKLELQSVFGKLKWACHVVRGGQTFVRQLTDILLRVSESHHHLRVNAVAKEDISCWLQGLTFVNETCSFKQGIPSPTHCFASDACMTGAGAYYGNDWFYCN